MQRYPELTKKQTFYFISLFPTQSNRVKSAVLTIVNSISDKSYSFNDLMNKLFWSKNINARAGYFHFRTLLQRNNSI
jgi:hypothetical protein